MKVILTAEKYPDGCWQVRRKKRYLDHICGLGQAITIPDEAKKLTVELSNVPSKGSNVVPIVIIPGDTHNSSASPYYVDIWLPGDTFANHVGKQLSLLLHQIAGEDRIVYLTIWYE